MLVYSNRFITRGSGHTDNRYIFVINGYYDF